MKPKVSDDFDYEGELAVVIGKTGRHIPASRALDHVAGYACYNEGSIRDWQRHTSQFLAGKTFAESGSFGPWMVTRDDIPDPAKLTLQTRLNGNVVQDTTTDLMITAVPELIAYISTICPLAGCACEMAHTTAVIAFKRSRCKSSRNDAAREPESSTLKAINGLRRHDFAASLLRCTRRVASEA